MLNEDQILEKRAKVKEVIEAFLKDKKMIREIASETGISKSSVQRYLNDIQCIKELYGSNSDFIISEISKRLSENKEYGAVLGGMTFSENNIPLRDDKTGHFKGSIRR